MGCATSMVKYLLFFFNFLFVVGGGALIALGALQYNGYKTYENFIELGAYQAPPITMMVVGAVMFLIAFMGCCGAIQESKCMMMSYATLLMLLLIAEVAIAVGVAVYKDDFKEYLKGGMEKGITEYTTKPEVKEAWDTIQMNLKCCGIDGYKDWEKSENKKVPTSCCITPVDGCSAGMSYAPPSIAQEKIYIHGCLDKSLDDLKTDYVIYGAIAVAAIELLGVIFGCCLGARFGRKTYTT